MAEETKTFKLEEEMTPEELQKQQENEDFLLALTDEDLTDPDKVEEINKRLADAKTTIHQKRHFREKLKAVETPAPEKKEEKKPVKDAPANDTSKVDAIVGIEFRQDHPELTKDVVKEILKYAGNSGITPEEALSSPIIQNYIKSEQTKEDVDGASIAPGTKGTGSGIEKKDWSTASQADIEKQRNKILNGQ